MDKGTHYYRCDFQVHTPRDQRWTGGDATTEEERQNYAKEFIHACRVKLLDAVAITDHHDLTFFKYIKDAANNELDEENNPIPQEKKIIVFPGMELTLGIPCQAIIIFDANFLVDLFTQIYPVLSITQTPATDSKQAEVTRLENIAELSKLYDDLNNRDFIKDRFIVLPNVSETGYGTILRSGFHPKYKEMPCVGGYLDGSISQLGNGNTRILNGKDTNYGPKKLGIFQTSDNRQRDFSSLGQYSTWVKWAVPTAEALRQACLAKESRISQDTPELPSIFVTSIDVSNSKFMGQLYLEFNNQYNAIIGGRGTGKSTILEYLRWGLCDQIPDNDEIPSYQGKRKKLIEKTLLPFESIVQVSFIKNNIPHVIRHKASTNELLLKIGIGEFESCSEDNVRNLLPIQAYSQKQLSSVGVSIEELKRLIYSPVRQSLNEFDSKFEKLRANIKACYELRLRKRLMESDIEKNELELKSLSEQVEGLRKNLKGISDEDKITIESHKQYEVIEQLVDGWQGELTSAKEALEGLIRDIEGSPTAIPDDAILPDKEQVVIVNIHKEIKTIFDGINSTINSLNSNLNAKVESLLKLNSLIEKWEEIRTLHKQKYETAKGKSTSQETILTQIQKIEERIKEIRKSLMEKKQSVLKAGDPEINFNNLKKEWFNIHRERADLLESQCSRLNDLSDSNLKATLGRGKGLSNFEETLKRMITGTNIRQEKIGAISNQIISDTNPINKWDTILLEFETLANFDLNKNPSKVLPTTPILNSAGFTENDLRKVAEKITSENWIDLFLVQLDDLPLFEYKTREEEYIEFTDASAGQQATALMHVLLNQEGPPLIIDQPEDDLDNQMISDIAALIWKAKKKRQLIFTSHNANIVVNGDAELVVCCDYKVTGDQSKGEIKRLGAIDIQEIRNEITAVMEGGEEAFKLRKEKYGF
ncbi:MAG: AAA family ATPase [bacterium]|nr:AAA family ATPase [bacterium]